MPPINKPSLAFFFIIRRLLLGLHIREMFEIVQGLLKKRSRSVQKNLSENTSSPSNNPKKTLRLLFALTTTPFPQIRIDEKKEPPSMISSGGIVRKPSLPLFILFFWVIRRGRNNFFLGGGFSSRN